MPDITYTYADAVREGICRPVTFIPYDGVLQWRSRATTSIEASFADALDRPRGSRRYRTAISVELADGLPRILAAAHAKLEEVRAGGHRDAGGLVVAADSDHAREIAKILKAVTGKRADGRPAHRGEGGREARGVHALDRAWIVAVNMVCEGVDIPRLRVGVYATAAKTPLIFRQIVGRFVRTIPGRPADMSWLYLPATRSSRRTPTRSSASCATCSARRPRPTRSARRARGAARDRARPSSPRSSRRGRRRPAAGAVRAARRAAPAPAAIAPARGRRRTPTRADPRPRRSSAARSCATSATASSPTSAAATAAATPRSTGG